MVDEVLGCGDAVVHAGGVRVFGGEAVAHRYDRQLGAVGVGPELIVVACDRGLFSKLNVSVGW